MANSGTYNIQEASSIHPTVTLPYLQGRGDVCLGRASSPATTKAAAPPGATLRNFKIEFNEARPRNHTALHSLPPFVEGLLAARTRPQLRNLEAKENKQTKTQTKSP